MDAVKRLAKHGAVLAALSGVLLTLGFPPASLWWTAWFALVPLYIALVRVGQNSKTPKTLWRSFGMGWAFGMALFLVGMVWMLEIGSVPWAILSAIETLPIAVHIALFAAFAPLLPARLRPFAFAALFCIFEWLRSQTIYAFPWFILSGGGKRGWRGRLAKINAGSYGLFGCQRVFCGCFMYMGLLTKHEF